MTDDPEGSRAIARALLDTFQTATTMTDIEAEASLISHEVDRLHDLGAFKVIQPDSVALEELVDAYVAGEPLARSLNMKVELDGMILGVAVLLGAVLEAATDTAVVRTQDELIARVRELLGDDQVS